jgi:hypothetical protein
MRNRPIETAFALHATTCSGWTSLQAAVSGVACFFCAFIIINPPIGKAILGTSWVHCFAEQL